MNKFPRIGSWNKEFIQKMLNSKKSSWYRFSIRWIKIFPGIYIAIIDARLQRREKNRPFGEYE